MPRSSPPCWLSLVRFIQVIPPIVRIPALVSVLKTLIVAMRTIQARFYKARVPALVRVKRRGTYPHCRGLPTVPWYLRVLEGHSHPNSPDRSTTAEPSRGFSLHKRPIAPKNRTAVCIWTGAPLNLPRGIYISMYAFVLGFSI